MTVFARPFGPVFSQTMFDTQLAAFRPSFSVDFTREELPDNFTFTRASSATDDSSGTLLTFGNNAYRRSDQKGLRLEGARTNSIRNGDGTGATLGVIGSGGVRPTNWSQALATGLNLEITEITTRSGVSGVGLRFFGTPTTASTTIAFEPSGQIPASSTQVWTSSFYHRLNNGSTSGTIINCRTQFDGGATSVSTAITPTSTLTRGVATATADGTTTSVRTQLTMAHTLSVAIDFTLFIGGVQCELGTFASSYIPTTGTAATRAADVCTITNLASIGYNALESTILAEFEYMGIVSVAGQRVIEISDGTANERLGIGISSSGRLSTYVVDGGAVQVSIDAITTPLANTMYKIAFGYKENDFAASANGGAVVTDTLGTLPTTTQANLGSSGGLSAANFAFSWLRRFTYYPTRLSNGQLPTLSTL